MIQFLSALILLFPSQQTPRLPQHHPLSDEYRKEWQEAYRQWKPGPKVAAEIGVLLAKAQKPTPSELGD